MRVRVLDLLEQERAHGALERGRDLLRLVRHGKAVQVDVLPVRQGVRLEQPSEHADEGSLPGPVLAQHDHDLRVGELARLDVQGELGGAGLAEEVLHRLSGTGARVLERVCGCVYVVCVCERTGHADDTKSVKRQGGQSDGDGGCQQLQTALELAGGDGMRIKGQD